MASKVEKRHFDQYLSEAKSWETDRLIAAEKSKRIAWVVAIFAGAIALMSAFAIAGLTPLKSTELRIIRVDRKVV